jgi:hypothetical protein
MKTVIRIRTAENIFEPNLLILAKNTVDPYIRTGKPRKALVLGQNCPLCSKVE